MRGMALLWQVGEVLRTASSVQAYAIALAGTALVVVMVVPVMVLVSVCVAIERLSSQSPRVPSEMTRACLSGGRSLMALSDGRP